MQQIYLMMLLPADPAPSLDVVLLEVSGCVVSEVKGCVVSEVTACVVSEEKGNDEADGSYNTENNINLKTTRCPYEQ